MTRHSGVLMPLFSAPSTGSWGLGELADVGPFAAWLGTGGFDRLMLLPIGPLSEGVSSPYSSVSAMAIDPMYVALDAVEDFRRAGGVETLGAEARRALAAARASPRIDYRSARRAKREALDLAFRQFVEDEWNQRTIRAGTLAGYIARERWWLGDYALFQAIVGAEGTTDWPKWPAALAAREPRALDEARRELAREVLRQQYWQWLAEEQWQAARSAARRSGVAVFGDLPFVVSRDSADVWTRATEFLLDVSAGAPPDAFSDEGQDWQLPTYNWPAVAAGGFAWIRQRARRMAALYDGVRIDHLVGFFRTYARPKTGEPYFTPPDMASQIELGRQILGIFLESGATILAEDLGTVPDFVRATLAELGVPGFKVLRWERAWTAPGQAFDDPAAYPPVSVATTGTHDTETLADWWDHADAGERAAVLALPGMQPWQFDPAAPWSDDLRDALLELVYRSGSNELLLPIQDVFGWRDRINVPATIDGSNWTWRLPWPVDRLAAEPAAVDRARFCRLLARAAGRG